MFRPAFLALAGALIEVVNGSPAPSTVSTAIVDGKPFPVVDLTDTVSAHPNVTLGAVGPHVDIAQATYPAILWLCQTNNCGSCSAVDLSITPHSVCTGAGFVFTSVLIAQPSNEGLPFSVYAAWECSFLINIPAVNVCYDLLGQGPFVDYELHP